MKNRKEKIEIPQGYKAEWVNNVLTLVKDESNIVYYFRILRNGMLLDSEFATEEDAQRFSNDGDSVVKMQKQVKASYKPNVNIPRLPFDSSWIFIVLGAFITCFGLYKFILTDNETATTVGLIKIGIVTVVGILILIFGWKGKE